MALISCSECGKEISDKAAACPNCGNPIASAPSVEKTPIYTSAADKPDHKKRNMIIVFLVVLTAVAFGAYYFTAVAPKNVTLSKLQKSWSSMADSDTYDKKWMTFATNGIVTYEYDSFLLGRKVLSTDHYEVLSPTELKIGGTVYTIRFYSDSMLIFEDTIHNEKNWF